MPYYLYHDVDDDRVYAYDAPQPDLAARPGWQTVADQGTPASLAAIARLEASRAAATRDAAMRTQAEANRAAAGARVLVLGPAEQVPPGTAAGTVIVRRTT